MNQNTGNLVRQETSTFVMRQDNCMLFQKILLHILLQTS